MLLEEVLVVDILARNEGSRSDGVSKTLLRSTSRADRRQHRLPVVRPGIPVLKALWLRVLMF